MMTDADLMILAAKASGVGIQRSRLDDPLCKDFLLARRADDENGVGWNPLTDDGDALRLAVALILDIRHVCDEVSVCGLFGEWYTEPVFEDRLECTRRAIVRAAASIGKLMP